MLSVSYILSFHFKPKYQVSYIYHTISIFKLYIQKETPKFKFSRNVLIFTNTLNFHVKSLNFDAKSLNFDVKSLNFHGLYTNCHGIY